MMENPFFRNYRNSYRPQFSPKASQQRNPAPRKVVSIPIHFVESEKTRNTRSAAALKIQKVFRGFLVRKSVKKIVGIKAEVDEIERRISKSETVVLIKKESKERLKMNEMLMALLFRLDSVRGVDSGVRDLRKAVIRKAILLQERIDAIVAGDQTLDRMDGEEDADQSPPANDVIDGGIEEQDSKMKDCSGLEEVVDQNIEVAGVTDSSQNPLTQEATEDLADQTIETQEAMEDLADRTGEMQDAKEPELGTENTNLADQIVEKQEVTAAEKSENLKIAAIEPAEEALGLQVCTESAIDSNGSSVENDALHGEEEESVQKNDPMPILSAEAENVGPEKLVGDEQSAKLQCVVENEEFGEKKVEEEMEMQQSSVVENEEFGEKKVEEEMEMQQSEKIQGSGGDGQNDLMEKMIEKNDKLMDLVTELCERNAMQTEMISSLSQRVEHLERAFKSDKLRRKKKRQGAGAEKAEVTKCGRKS